MAVSSPRRYPIDYYCNRNYFIQYKLIIVRKDTEDKDIIGEAEINVAEYGINEYQPLNLPLTNCTCDDKAYLEIALRGKQIVTQ
jgi:hypothetical protein